MSQERPVAAIILAAGASRRLGQPKQLIRLGKETLVERAVRVSREAALQPILVVLGCEADLIRSECDLSGADMVPNPHWEQGMATSIFAGVEVLHSEYPAVTGTVLLVCDQPGVTAHHLQLLCATGQTTASEYGDRRGVPAFFPASTFSELKKLTGDTGARELLRSADSIPLPNGELDVDTPEALATARRTLGYLV